jgi:hypothetical protein
MSSSSRNRFAGSRIIPFGTVVAALGPFYATECVAQPEVGLEIDAVAFGSDNPFLLPGDDRASGAMDVTARPYVDWHLDPGTKFEFTGELGFRQYFQHYGNFVTGLADAELRHRHNEFLTVTGQARYSRDLTSDILTDSVDLAFDTRGIRESAEARGAVTWTPDATTTVTADGGWQHLEYPGSLILQTTEAFDFGAGISKQLSPRTAVGFQGRMTSSRPEISEETSVNSFNLTANHRFAEEWRGDIRLGVERSQLNAPFGTSQDERTRFNGGINLCYEPQHTTACLNSSVGSEVSGLGGLQREFAVSGTIRSRLSEYGTISAEASMRKTDIAGTSASGRVLRASSGYEHRLSRTLYLTSGASYLQRQINSAKVGAFIVQIGFSIRGERA